MAVMRDKEMTLDDYYREPVQVEPFRRADFCLSSEGATCLLVTTLERAREMRKAPIVIAGMEGIRASRDDHIMFARPGLGVGLQEERSLNQFKPPRIYERAGRSRDEIDGLYVYDSFTSNLWMVLERFGFCNEGEAAGYINQFGFDLTSKVPINTNGGLLSEGFLSGYGHLVEMTRQLRGEAGDRQINAEVLQWATPRGDSLIFTKAA
jgi:acetyl-CoA acetyltransferase